MLLGYTTPESPESLPACLPACLPASLPFLPACLPASLGVGLDEELVKMTKEVPPYISKLWNGLSTTGE